MIIVPIEIDCAVPDILKKYKNRKFALPFDWVVTYNGIKNIIENDIADFLLRNSVYRENNDIVVFNKYDVKFIHDKFNESDIEKYNRRIARFKDLLNNKELIIFLKKGHSYHHHGEYNFIDDIQDVSNLHDFLKLKYPLLKFKIILVLLCYHCYKDTCLNNISPDIIIINKPTLQIRENLRENKLISSQHFDIIFTNTIIPLLKNIQPS